MFCSDDTRGYILSNGDQELFCLIDLERLLRNPAYR